MMNQSTSIVTSTEKQRILIFGCGYLGRVVAKQAIASGDHVTGTTRSEKNRETLRKIGIEPIVADWTDRRTLSSIDTFSTIVVSVSNDPSQRKPPWESLVNGLGNLLSAINQTTRVIYISTTGVYHQKGGIWVDETSPAHPNRPSAKAHLQAEGLLRRQRSNSPWSILRLAGIYGPQRVPRCDQIRLGNPIHADPSSYLNLIHVEDAASAALAASKRDAQDVYLVSDDQPALRADYYAHIAQQISAPPPKFASKQEVGSHTIRSDSNKRVWNRRMKKELLPKLKYPTHREGLSKLLK